MYTQMTNLTAYTTEDGIELQIDNLTGESFASQRAIARMCEVDAVYIRRFVSGTNVEGKTAEILTDAGLRSGTLHSEDTILLCIAKYNPQLMPLFARAGLRVYLHGLAGYKFTSNDVAERAIPVDFESALEALLTEVRAKKALEAEVKILAPKAKLADVFLDGEGLTTIQQFCKDLGYKSNKLFAMLVDDGILFRTSLSGLEPYASQVDAGRFELLPTATFKRGQKNMQAFRTHLTTKGVQWLIEYLADKSTPELKEVTTKAYWK